MINISGRKAKVLRALYNASRPLGFGRIITAITPHPMTEKEAQALIDDKHGDFFDYINGRVLKVDLSQGEFDPRAYDRDNGQGAAQRAVEGIEAC